MSTETNDEASRRLQSRPWDHDCVLMRQIAEAFRQLIAKYIGSTRDLTIIDYGCGSLPYRALFTTHSRAYLGADLPTNPDADIFLDGQGSLPVGDATIDVIVSSQVLEHVLDVGHYLAECRRVLKQGGLMLLSTHGTWIYHPHPADLRRWTGWGLRFDIERSGFVVAETLPCLGPLAYATQLQLLLVKGLLLKLGMLGRWLSVPLSILGQCLIWIEEFITPAWLKADNACVYVVAARKALAGPDAVSA
jgi:SAM-dependent methyltransferase